MKPKEDTTINPPERFKTYSQKMKRANREVLYTLIALAVIVIAWFLGGIGLAGSGVEIASTPIWIVGGTVGTWLVAIVCAVVLARRVFANFDLDSDSDFDNDCEATLTFEAGETDE